MSTSFNPTLTLLQQPKQRSFFPEQFSNEIYYSQLKTASYLSYRSNFSIKYILKGSEAYLIDGQRFTPKSGQYLLVNEGRTIETTATCAQEAISIFLDKALIMEVATTLKACTTKLLDEPIDLSTSVCPAFFEHTFSHHDSLGHILQSLHLQLQQAPNQAFHFTKEVYYSIAEQLVLSQQTVQNQLFNIQAVKKSTREECYRRALLAKDFLKEEYNQPFNLENLAQHASLSKFHLIRVFKSCFGSSPYQYYLRQKINAAQQLMANTSNSITDIAYTTGFNDLFTFSKSFKKITGASPSQYRQQLTKD